MKSSIAVSVLCLLAIAAPMGASLPRPSAGQPQAAFIQIPGKMEFSGRLIVRPYQQQHWLEADLTAPEAQQRINQAIETVTQYVLVGYVPQTDEFIINVPDGFDENATANTLLATALFQYAEPDWILYPLQCPNDSRFNSQWHHVNMDSCAGWDIHTGDPSVSVGICDTGVRTTHEDLLLHRLEGYNAVDRLWEHQGGNINPVHPHGTMTTGCAAANGDNGVGISGVGWNLSHRMLRVSNSSGGGAYMSDLQHAARISVEAGDKVASVSYSGVDTSSNRTTATYIKSIGGLLVWAAGNDGRTLNWGDRDADDIIVAGATDVNDNLAYFSGRGPSVDLVAPGVNVYTTDADFDADYASVSGTSFATPLTAGLAALIWSADPALTPDQVEDILKQGTTDLGANGPDNTFGYGRINVLGSLSLVGGGGQPVSIAADDFESNSFAGGTGAWVGPWNPSGLTDVRWHDNAHSGLGFVRMRGSTGYMDRTVNLSGQSNVHFTFWCKINSFEGPDSADVLVSDDGVNFTVIHTFTSADSDNLWHQYDFDLAGFNMTSNFTVAFDANMSGSGDYYFIDDVDIVSASGGGNQPPVAALDATPLSGNAPLDVSFDASASSDPDGVIVNYEWDFDGDGTYDQSTGNSPYTSVTYNVPDIYNATVRVTDDLGATATDFVTITVLDGGGTVSLAADDFESGSYDGGTGAWNAPWTESGLTDIRWHSNAHSGMGFIRMRGSTGYLSRSANLAGDTSVRLTFWAQIHSFEGADTADVLVSEDGVNFTVIHTFTSGDSDDIWHQYDIDLSGFTMTANFTIAFDANMSGGGDYYYIDDVEIVGVP